MQWDLRINNVARAALRLSPNGSNTATLHVDENNSNRRKISLWNVADSSAQHQFVGVGSVSVRLFYTY
jgi:hypothetical protein